MRIAIANFSSLSDQSVIDAVRAVNRQLSDDFARAWSVNAELYSVAPDPNGPDPDLLRGDAVIYVCDDTDRGVLGYHQQNAAAVPYGYVFTALAEKLKKPWTQALSHEVLETIIDPDVNQLVAGPDPTDATHLVMHLKEICDPVQRDGYAVDGVTVSNFVTPAYYSTTTNGKTDWLGTGVASFGANPGGYIEYRDPATGYLCQWGTPAAMRVLKTKRTFLKDVRRSTRHAVTQFSTSQCSRKA